MKMASDDQTWKNSKKKNLGIVKPLMANQPFVINVKEGEKVWLSSMKNGEIDEYGCL